MKTFSKPEPVTITYPVRAVGAPEKLLFFDIETTGLTPSRAQIYLIGALTREENGGWILRQWFADSLSSEQEILRAFFEFARNYSILVHYNGDGFDLPFLDKCAFQYHLENPLKDMISIDLYRTVRPYRKLFRTERLNQKAMENFLGIRRADRFSGAELISVYGSFLSSADPASLELLLLHNEEDVTGLTSLLSMISYSDFFRGDLSDPIALERGGNIILDYGSEACLPKPVSLSLPPVTLSARDSVLEFTVSEYRGTASHYFENYRDYYYLPAEDKAVHKSVGEFVDRSARVKATAETACVKKDGIFFPLFGPANRPVFFTEYKGAMRYVQKNDYDFTDRDNLLKYGYAVLKYFGLR